MKCRQCALNTDSASFQPLMLKKVPVTVRRIFLCSSSGSIENSHRTLPECRSICPRDLWVLAFISANDRFAVERAADTLDTLVAGGHAELLCSLFECAGYETRRELWQRMTKFYPERLYMFDALFERECLAPLVNGTIPDNFHVYQHQMMFGTVASQPGADDL